MDMFPLLWFQLNSKIIFLCAEHTDTKIQIHKYTNTAYDEVPERLNVWHIFEKGIVQGCQEHLSFAQSYEV